MKCSLVVYMESNTYLYRVAIQYRIHDAHNLIAFMACRTSQAVIVVCSHGSLVCESVCTGRPRPRSNLEPICAPPKKMFGRICDSTSMHRQFFRCFSMKSCPRHRKSPSHTPQNHGILNCSNSSYVVFAHSLHSDSLHLPFKQTCISPRGYRPPGSRRPNG